MLALAMGRCFWSEIGKNKVGKRCSGGYSWKDWPKVMAQVYLQ
jgi:hypothetical protein